MMRASVARVETWQDIAGKWHAATVLPRESASDREILDAAWQMAHNAIRVSRGTAVPFGIVQDRPAAYRLPYGVPAVTFWWTA